MVTIVIRINFGTFNDTLGGSKAVFRDLPNCRTAFSSVSYFLILGKICFSLVFFENFTKKAFAI